MVNRPHISANSTNWQIIILMAEDIQIELNHEEAEVSEYILKNIVQIEAREQELLSSLHNVDRIRAAKKVLRKIQIGKRQRISYIENTQSSERTLTTPAQADNARLSTENKALHDELKEIKTVWREVEKALNSNNYEYAKGLINQLRDIELEAYY